MASVERRDRKPNEVEICRGSLSLPAFTVNNGKTDDRREWNVHFEVEHPTVKDGTVEGVFVFEFAERLPELPDWAMTR